MNSVSTPKGTTLPLVILKGKPYLQVMHRIQWFNEQTDSFDIQTTIVTATKDESVVTSKITIFGQDGKVVKSASATKREDAKGFGDHLEKAETGSIGRALALLGFGTQFAVADLDEGTRIVDSPAPSVQPLAKNLAAKIAVAEKKVISGEIKTPDQYFEAITITEPATPAKTFRKPKAATEKSPDNLDDWT